MSTLLDFGRDVQGYNSYAPPFAADNFKVTLASGVAQQFTVPSNFKNWIIAFSPQIGTNIWVARNTTATLPSGTITATSSTQNPGARQALGGDTVSMITNSTTSDVGVSLYAIS